VPNAPLRGCPMCGRAGGFSFVRSGSWLNRHCPDANGPVDADDYPDGHEVDSLARRRWARVEYKRPHEPVPVGQGAHLRALHDMAANGWEVLLLLVWDEGQRDGGAQVRFAWCSSRAQWHAPADWPEHRTTLEALGRSVAAWVWCGAARPAFACPPPPTCASCGAPLPRTPQQTMPMKGVPVWVCTACFGVRFPPPPRQLEVRL
jgi:hypothetical protein